MTEGVGDPRLVAEGEVSMARLALDDAEIRHAAEHVANALAADPTLPDAHAVLTTLLGHPEGGVELWPLDGEVYIGTVVARAHAAAFGGNYADALSLIVSAQRYEPAAPWADVAWVLDPAMPAKLTPDELISVFAGLFPVMPEPFPEELRPAFSPYLALARHGTAAHGNSAAVWWAASILVRRLGLLDEAADYAARSEHFEPTDRAAIALGYALREQGRTDDALAALERALRYRPDNLAVHADVAAMLGDAGLLRSGAACSVGASCR
ncbi:tetratricopeptide repeat protein [Kribbella swartbergensis]